MTIASTSLFQVGVALAVLAVFGFLLHVRRRRRLADFLGGPRAASRIFRADLYRLRTGRLALILGTGLGLALAAGGLTWTDEPPPAVEPLDKVVITIDVSASMQASDLTPTRLARAVEVARRLVAGLEDTAIGLVLFAGTPYRIAPPTLDHDALGYFLDGVTPTIASALDPGTRLSAGVAASLSFLPDEEDPERPIGGRAVVLLTDGESDAPDPELATALERSRTLGVAIHTVAVGTTGGSTMMMPAGRYQLGGPVLDATGAPARSRLAESALRGIAEEGGGRFHSESENVAVDVANALSQARSELQDADPAAAESEPWDLPLLFGLAALSLLLLDSVADLPELRRRQSAAVRRPPTPARERGLG